MHCSLQQAIARGEYSHASGLAASIGLKKVLIDEFKLGLVYPCV
jgi:hypothetical protein